ncbi:hypothetical protein DPMN_077642 [Dreissena polymorpha]|uniref:Uncharacterized protein n=1 Tax=Dreissena polymorpha TaxID=45954 RepID=A0A9D4BPJ2_DREPO|nr:hypothetical protein DPMN_077642 [Dreissena polymorpha]
MKKWPFAKKVDKFLVKCDVQKEENLAICFKDHNHCAAFNVLSYITGICVLHSGLVLVANSYNHKVQLLSKAVPAAESLYVSEVQFIKVNNSQLVTERQLQLQHKCAGIANHQGDLLVSSGTALHTYSLNSKLARKLYENKTDAFTRV